MLEYGDGERLIEVTEIEMTTNGPFNNDLLHGSVSKMGCLYPREVSKHLTPFRKYVVILDVVAWGFNSPLLYFILQNLYMIELSQMLMAAQNTRYTQVFTESAVASLRSLEATRYMVPNASETISGIYISSIYAPVSLLLRNQ